MTDIRMLYLLTLLAQTTPIQSFLWDALLAVQDFSNETLRDFETCEGGPEKSFSELCTTQRFSCRDRCNIVSAYPFDINGENSNGGCACDSLCVAHQDCCWDFQTHCPEQHRSAYSQYSHLLGVSMKCYEGYIIITGCGTSPVHGEHESQHEDKREQILTIITNDQTVITYQNQSVHLCNDATPTGKRQIRWEKRVQGKELDFVHLLQNFILTGNSSENGVDNVLQIHDVPPATLDAYNTSLRHCFEYVETYCHSIACYYRTKFTASSLDDLCHYLNRSLVSYDGHGVDIDADTTGESNSVFQALNTTGESNSIFQSPNTAGESTDESNSIFQAPNRADESNSNLQAPNTTGASQECEYDCLVTTFIFVRHKTNKGLSLLLSLNEADSSYSVSEFSVEKLWSHIYCLKGVDVSMNATCTATAVCEKGNVLYDGWVCLEPKSVRIATQSRSKIWSINARQLFIQELPLISSLYFVGKMDEGEKQNDDDGMWEHSSTWEIIEFPFQDDQEMIEILATAVRTVAPTGFLFYQEGNITICFTRSFYEKCSTLMDRGQLLHVQAQSTSPTPTGFVTSDTSVTNDWYTLPSTMTSVEVEFNITTIDSSRIDVPEEDENPPRSNAPWSLSSHYMIPLEIATIGLATHSGISFT